MTMQHVNAETNHVQRIIINRHTADFNYKGYNHRALKDN